MMRFQSALRRAPSRNLDQSLWPIVFRRVKEKQTGKHVKVGFPRFKSKKNGLGNFRLTGSIRVFEKAIRVAASGAGCA